PMPCLRTWESGGRLPFAMGHAIGGRPASPTRAGASRNSEAKAIRAAALLNWAVLPSGRFRRLAVTQMLHRDEGNDVREAYRVQDSRRIVRPWRPIHAEVHSSSAHLTRHLSIESTRSGSLG